MSVMLRTREIATTGPGGTDCPCCTDWNPKRDLAKLRRTVRRRERRDFRAEVRELIG